MTKPKAYPHIDPLQAIKNAYDAKTGSLKTVAQNSLVPTSYGKVEFSYINIVGEPCIEVITYYGDGQSQASQITVPDDVAGNLNGTYFFLWSANNETKYYVWLNDGTAVDPDPDSGASTGIEVAYSPNNSAYPLAQLISAAIQPISDFASTWEGRSVVVVNMTHGACNEPTDGDMGTIVQTLKDGVNRGITSVVKLEYDNDANLVSAERVFFE
jgi:hypothetical protein